MTLSTQNVYGCAIAHQSYTCHPINLRRAEYLLDDERDNRTVHMLLSTLLTFWIEKLQHIQRRILTKPRKCKIKI